MTPAPRPHLVDVAALPDYPLGRDVRLDGNSFVKLGHRRWLQSSLHLVASYEVQGMAVALICLAQDQTPVGTLPDDDLILARLLRVDHHRWQTLRADPNGPLRGWQLCLSDGERRLWHPVVLEQVRDVLDRREARELSRGAQAERRRIERLQAALRSAGCAPVLVDDLRLVGRMDQWLTDHWHGNRTQAAITQVLEFAGRAGWLTRGS